MYSLLCRLCGCSVGPLSQRYSASAFREPLLDTHPVATVQLAKIESKVDHQGADDTTSAEETDPAFQEPQFDEDNGFPMNAAAQNLCAQQWLGGSAVGPYHCLPYHDLEKCTDNFAPMLAIGTGGSCEVYRGILYGVPVG